jgi:hypothetical protein
MRLLGGCGSFVGFSVAFTESLMALIQAVKDDVFRRTLWTIA